TKAYDREEGIVRIHLAPFANLQLAAIRKADIQRYVTAAASQCAPGSVRTIENGNAAPITKIATGAAKRLPLYQSESQSDRSACMTSTRAARAAGSTDAMTVAARITPTDPISGGSPGSRTS